MPIYPQSRLRKLEAQNFITGKEENPVNELLYAEVNFTFQEMSNKLP